MDTRITTVAIAAAASACVLAGCGGSHTASTSRTPSKTGNATDVTARSSSDAVDVGSVYALTSEQVQSAAGSTLPSGTRFSVTREGKFMGAPGTDQRFFDSTDGAYDLEVDVVADGRPDGATQDYAQLLSYVSQDLSNTVHSTPSIGNQADEYTGIAQANNALVGVDAISFREGATVGMVFLAASDGAPAMAAGEAVARALAQHVSSVVMPPGPCGSDTCVARFEGTTDSSSAAVRIKKGGWYAIEHFTYPVTAGAACALDSWSIHGPGASVADTDAAMALAVARAESEETEYLKPGAYVIDFSTEQCFWRVLVEPAASPIG